MILPTKGISMGVPPGRGISVGIKTFLRPKALDLCLDSLCGYSWDEVIVANDSPSKSDDDYALVYRRYGAKLPLRVIELPTDTGLASGRNHIVSVCSSEYLLMLDDDQVIDSSIRKMREVLAYDQRLGGVSCIWIEGGRRSCTGSDIFLKSGYVVKQTRNRPRVQKTPSGTRYVTLDFIPNSTLFRTSCFDDILWDPTYKIGREHIDFFLRHKLLGQWKFAVSLDTQICHYPELGAQDYASMRHGERLRTSEAYFRNKFGVQGVLEGRKWMGGRRFFTALNRCGVPVRFADWVDWRCRKLKTSMRSIVQKPMGLLT